MASLTVEDVAELSDKEAKFALLKMVDPTLNDNQAAKLCDYAPKSGTQVKNRVAGKLGGILADHGITLDSVAETMVEGLKARRTKGIYVNKYNTNGKVISTSVKVIDIGPDYGARNNAAKTVVMFEKLGEKELKAPDQSQIEAPEIPEADLQKAVGRGGPTEVIEADFEEVDDAQTG